MNLEEAKEISKGFTMKPGKDALLKDLQEHFQAKGFLEGHAVGINSCSQLCFLLKEAMIGNQNPEWFQKSAMAIRLYLKAVEES